MNIAEYGKARITLGAFICGPVAPLFVALALSVVPRLGHGKKYIDIIVRLLFSYDLLLTDSKIFFTSVTEIRAIRMSVTCASIAFLN